MANSAVLRMYTSEELESYYSPETEQERILMEHISKLLDKTEELELEKTSLEFKVEGLKGDVAKLGEELDDIKAEGNLIKDSAEVVDNSLEMRAYKRDLEQLKETNEDLTSRLANYAEKSKRLVELIENQRAEIQQLKLDAGLQTVGGLVDSQLNTTPVNLGPDNEEYLAHVKYLLNLITRPTGV